ncbi:HEAT repeat domain-containing protein [candidate division KSB1 bacterium]|nr:HEAT repeat domain-containing protein [candidate division KSB1 bacterium]
MNNFKTYIPILLLLLFHIKFHLLFGREFPKIPIITEPPTIAGSSSFAIFVDSTTFINTGSWLLKYRKSIENDGLPTYIIIANWSYPEQLQEVIQDLYKQKKHKLEGIVLIGEIPIVMLLDAQYLTSAFRTDPTNQDLFKTSVPTDRFYDDFDLKCNFVQQDSANRLLHYYRLSPDSVQKLEKEIYSARIQIPPDTNKNYKILVNYFKKIVRIKSAPREALDNIIAFTGFNYMSGSHTAFLDEMITLREIFNLQKITDSRLQSIDYRSLPNLKQQLFRYLNIATGDLFLMHAHGNEENQYLLEKESIPIMAEDNSTLQSQSMAENADETTITINDIGKRNINSEVVLLDVCYNGAFQYARNMAHAYLFSPGEVVVVMANSVNVRQDIALVENLGSLAFGARVGQWHQVERYLESHLFGDPTFRFANAAGEADECQPPFERMPLIACNPGNLKKIIKESPWPYLRASALNALYQLKVNDFQEFLKPGLKDPANIVRLKSWLLLAEQRDTEFITRLPEGLNDSYELIRRNCVIWMGEIGSNSFVQHLARVAIQDPSERVLFNALTSLKLIGTQEARTALKWILSELTNYDDGKFLQQARANLFTMTQWLPNEIFPPLTKGTEEEKIKHIQLFRANRHLIALPILLFLYENDKSVAVRAAAAEVMGWYAFYEKRKIILESFEKTLQNAELDIKLKAATELARQRLIEGPNKINTP